MNTGTVSRDVASMYESTVVQDTVTSHMRDLPAPHGNGVSPSGRLPSERLRPNGSLDTGMLAEARDLDMTLRWWCLTVLPGARLHSRLCRPKESTCVPQRHWRGTQSFRASRIPSATLNIIFLSFNFFGPRAQSRRH